MNIVDDLNKISDKKYAAFQIKLTPGIDPNLFIGVRLPELRKYAKTISEEEKIKFMDNLPHTFYDENMLHSVLISNMKDAELCAKRIDTFLPYVDNWAVCDIMSPKVFKKHKDLLLEYINLWIKSKHTYTIRFAIEMLMSFYLDEDFKQKYLDMVSVVKSDEYYVNMMIAWYFATALAKQWDTTIKILENKCLDKWVHNKTIQKAIESYRITDDQKDYLRSLKIKGE